MSLKLYLIEILHQTTTIGYSKIFLLSCILSKFYIKPQPLRFWSFRWCSCILSKFYIKPQPSFRLHYFSRGCILSKFYIKPQQQPQAGNIPRVVSYRNSTSNHNLFGTNVLYNTLYLIEILHQTTTFL